MGMSTETERYEQSWIAAQSVLLTEWANLADKERARFVKYHRSLAELLDQLEQEWGDYSDHVALRAREMIAQDQDFIADHVCCVLVREENELAWWALPEVTHHRVGGGSTAFARGLPSDDGVFLIREWPTRSVVEIRNVPLGHPWLENTTEFTLANQGQPDWDEETQAIAETEGAVPEEVGVQIHAYATEHGKMPPQEWIDALTPFERLGLLGEDHQADIAADLLTRRDDE